MAGRVYRWSLSRGPIDIAMRFDMTGAVAQGASRIDAGGPFASALPAFSFGVRIGGAGQGPPARTLLERAMAEARAQPASKIGVEWKPAESQVNFLREGLGLRLDGSDRMTVRLRKGVVGVYMHRKF